MSLAPQPVTTSMTVIIERALAGYCLFNTLTQLPPLVAQLPTTAVWWKAVFVPAFAVTLALMVWRCARRQSIRGWCGAYAMLVLAGIATGPIAFPPAPGTTPWLWISVGQAIVAACVWGGPLVGAAYALVTCGLYAVLRVRPEFGAMPTHIAVADGIQAFAAGLTLGITVCGIVRAGRGADLLAGRVSRRQSEDMLQAAMTTERVRLDRVIHDDVMTTLTSTAHALDRATTQAARALADHTIQSLGRLRTAPPHSGGLTSDLLVRLLEESVLRVSPAVHVVDRRAAESSRIEISAADADALLSAAREAVRNAVHHAHADTISVTVDQRPAPAGGLVQLTVVDDGRGFALGAVSADRLGIRSSINDRLRDAGGTAVVRSTLGGGTTVVLTKQFRSIDQPAPRSDRTGLDSAPAAAVRMPAEFPARLLVGLTWFAVAVYLGLGLRYEDAMLSVAPNRVAMLLVVVAMAALLHGGRGLRLPRPNLILAVALTVAAIALVGLNLRPDSWPGYGMWISFPVALIEVILILRQRGWASLAIWLPWCGFIGWWCWHTSFRFQAFSAMLFLPTAFLIIGWFVNRSLLEISRRQAVLQEQEAAALHGEIRRQVSQVQRSLWVADLDAAVRDVMLRIVADTGPIADELKRDCLVLERSLRESLVARNLMSEQLARLAEDARSRGVSLTFVDSRSTPAPHAVSRSVLATLTEALAKDSVSRVVVRLAPDSDAYASVVTADDTRTSVITIDPDGRRSQAR